MLANEESSLNELAISLPAGEAAQFFYGDNVEGYFEGFTHRTAGGSGYWIDGKPVFRDVVTSVGHRILLHEQARGADILPHAIRHHHDAGLVDIAILHRQRAVAISITPSREENVLAQILFDGCVGNLSVELKPDGLSVAFSGIDLAAGISATRSVTGIAVGNQKLSCLLYTSPSPRD